MSRIVRIGTKVDPYGEVSAVGWIGGERYYWLVDGNAVAMIPASIIETREPKETT